MPQYPRWILCVANQSKFHIKLGPVACQVGKALSVCLGFDVEIDLVALGCLRVTIVKHFARNNSSCLIYRLMRLIRLAVA